MSHPVTPAPVPALTSLSEDERLFRESVLDFARREIAPLVRQMDEDGLFSPELLPKLFELGVMSIEVPESYGGAGASFFHSVLAVEALAEVDPSVSVLVDVQNTLVINAILRWGTEEVKRRTLPRLASSSVGAYALSEAGSGSDAFALTTRATAGWRRLPSLGPQALDHQRARSRPLHRLCDGRSRGGLSRHHRVPHRAWSSRFHRRQEGRQAGHSCEQHLRARLRRAATWAAMRCWARSGKATRSRSRR